MLILLAAAVGVLLLWANRPARGPRRVWEDW